MTKNKINFSPLCIHILFAMLSFGCVGNKKDAFFFNLKGANVTMRMSSSRYFIKSFGIESVSTSIADSNYWRLRDDENSYFYIEGYLKDKGDSIVILPVDYKLGSTKQGSYKLFDFTLDKQQSWNLLFKLNSGGEDSNGYSISFLNKHIEKSDILFEFSMTPLIYHKKIKNYDFRNFPTFYVTVSKLNGLIAIKRLNGLNKKVVYAALIYPEISFVNNADSTKLDL